MHLTNCDTLPARSAVRTPKGRKHADKVEGKRQHPVIMRKAQRAAARKAKRLSWT